MQTVQVTWQPGGTGRVGQIPAQELGQGWCSLLCRQACEKGPTPRRHLEPGRRHLQQSNELPKEQYLHKHDVLRSDVIAHRLQPEG